MIFVITEKWEIATAFGLPVVPLEKHKNASFVLASLGTSFRSINAAGSDNPSSTSLSTVRYGPFAITLSIKMILLKGIPVSRAAFKAVGKLSECTTNQLALVVSIWYTSSSAV